MPFLFSTNLSKSAGLWHQTMPIHPQAVNALFLGMSVFTTFRSDNAYCWRRTHLKRLYEHGKRIGLDLPVFRDFAGELEAQLTRLLGDSPSPHRVRLTLFPADYSPALRPPFQTACVVDLQNALPEIPKTLQGKGLHLVVVSYETSHPQLKQGSQLPALLLHHAKASDVDAVLWKNSQGELTESTHANLLFHHRSWGWCMPPNKQALDGVTLQQIRKASDSVGLQLVEHRLRVDDLAEVDALFLTNSIHGMQAVASVEAGGHRWEMEGHPSSHDLFTAWRSLAFDGLDGCYSAFYTNS
jgi:branched-subunit amino acid aminotransferase/4-amino-4-deoxychorismate lyase